MCAVHYENIFLCIYLRVTITIIQYHETREPLSACHDTLNVIKELQPNLKFLMLPKIISNTTTLPSVFSLFKMEEGTQNGQLIFMSDVPQAPPFQLYCHQHQSAKIKKYGTLINKWI